MITKADLDVFVNEDCQKNAKSIQEEIIEEKCCWGHVNPFQQVTTSRQIITDYSDYYLLENLSGKTYLQAALSFNTMADSKVKKELIKLPLIKDAKVDYWLESDSDLANIVSVISEDIMHSAKKFGTEIKQIKMTEAFKGLHYEEIEVEIKVPEEMDMDEADDFWDQVGVNVGKLIEQEGLTDARAKEIKQRILIVVTQ